MKRASLNFLIDAVALVTFSLIVSTGFLLRYVFPPGSGRLEGSGSGWGASQKAVSVLWGYARHEWGEFHFWVSVAFVAVLALHVLLHWRWIVSVVRGRRPRQGSGARFSLGVVSLVSLVVLSIAPFYSQKEQVPREALGRTDTRGDSRTETQSHTEMQMHAEEHVIRGSMTLREVERETGVPISYILKELGMPADTSPDETLGRLRKSYDFEMSDIRRIVTAYGASAP